MLTYHLQLPEKAASWQLHGLSKHCKVKDNKCEKVLS